MSYRLRLSLFMAVGVFGVVALLLTMLRVTIDGGERLQRTNDVALPAFESARQLRADVKDLQRALQDAAAAEDADAITAAEDELKRLDAVLSGMRIAGLIDEATVARLRKETAAFGKDAVLVARATIKGERGPDVLEAMQRMVTSAQSLETGLLAIQEEARRTLSDDLARSRAEQDSLRGGLITFTMLGAVYLVVVLFLVVRPVDRLARGFERVGTGQQGQRLPVDGDDEFGRIGKDANAMLDRLDELARAATDIADGRTGQRVRAVGQDDHLATSFNRLAQWIDEMAQMASRIARGELVQVRPRGPDDLLGLSFQAMTRSLDDSVRIAEAIAAGDLDVSVQRRGDHDRLGLALSAMVSSLKGATTASTTAARALTTSGDRLSQASRGVAAQARDQSESARALESAVAATEGQSRRIAERASELVAQAARMRQALEAVTREVDDGASRVSGAAAAMADLSGSAGGVADAVRAVRDNARAFADVQATVVSSSERMVEAASDMVARIDERGSELTGLVDEVARRASNIAGVVDVVQSIVEQTSLVALNASIVAAQADERGAAFAVVADEVKRLARTSRESMGEIGQSVAQIAGDANQMRQTVRMLLDEIRARGDEVAKGSAEVTAAMGGQQDRVVKLERVAQSLASDSRTVAHATESQKSTLSELERRLRALRDLATSLDAAVSAVDRACPVVRDAVVEQQQGLARAGERVRQVASGAQASQSAVQAVAAEAAMLDQQAHHLMAAVSALDRTAG